ncbi:MAG: efflux RND transporter permease subunit, partial [Planctomycetota bacterium]
EVKATLPPDVVINSELFQLRKFIDRGVFNVGEALIIGAILVILVLFLFLLNFRTTLITLTAIPLSLVSTTIVFKLTSLLTGSELSINVMTLGGLAVAIGELVDDAIVDVENIFRRLKENHHSITPKSNIEVVYRASLEIRNSIVFGTIIVILAFIPLFGITGLAGRLFAPLGFAYIVSILASLLVSLTVTPVLSYFLLPNTNAAKQGDGFLLSKLKSLATVFIKLGMKIPGTLLAFTWVGVLASAWLFSQMGGGFLPDFDEGSLQVNISLPPGSSLNASNKVCRLVDRKLNTYKKTDDHPNGEILHFVRRTGRAELDEHAIPVNVSEYIVSMNPESKLGRQEVIDMLQSELKEDVPGVYIEVQQPLAHLISHMVSGVYAEIAIKVFGDDLDKLQQLANQVKNAIENVDGVTDPIIEPIQRTEELQIRLRSSDLAFHGITRTYVAKILQTALQGEVVSQVLEGQQRFDLLVRFQEEYRTDYESLQFLRIDLPEQRGQIELRDVADIVVGYGPNALNRENARRRMVVRCNTAGRDLSSSASEIEQRVRQEVNLPQGYFFEFGGQFESQREASTTMAMLAAVSIAGMFITLLVLFPSIKIVLQILNALPTAFIGGVVALYLTDQHITISALVGFVSLGGIAVRNGILLVTHYIHLMRAENESFTKTMILRGSLERLAPVLMTALTAGIALLPLVIGGNEPGREILYPVATVILGGLVTSTFCEFLIHPGLFWKFSGLDAVEIARPIPDDINF